MPQDQQRGGVKVRPAVPTDTAAMRGIFASTVALGSPLPFAVAEFDAYADVCLGWFLGPELCHAGVLEDEGTVVGYALVATDRTGLARHQRRATAGLVRQVAQAALGGRLAPPARRFWFLRGLDAVALAGRARRTPAAVVAHFNLVPSARGHAGGRLLVEHIDRVVGGHGEAAWYGEVNALAGRRQRVLERYGAEVIAREPNRTLSWLTDQRVERLVTLRRLARAVPLAGTAPGLVDRRGR